MEAPLEVGEVPMGVVVAREVSMVVLDTRVLVAIEVKEVLGVPLEIEIGVVVVEVKEVSGVPLEI